MTHPHSIVMIAPVASLRDCNRLEAALGYQSEENVATVQTFSVKLSATGLAPATHFGCHTWETDRFKTELADMKTRTLPSKRWADHGLTETRAKDAGQAIIQSVRRGGGHPRTHFDDVLRAESLQKIPEPEL